jgi:very-short-patch-repair endonuclease
MSMVTTEIMRIAGQRRNLITRSSLRSLGLSYDRVRRMASEEVLVQVQPGVFHIGPATLDHTQRALAACLADPHVSLSHGTAAQIWGLRRAPRDQVEVLVTGTRAVRCEGVLVHRTNRLAPGDVTHFVDGTRVTSPARVLFDLAGVLDLDALRSVTEDALRRQLVSVATLAAVAEDLSGRGRRGTALFRELVAENRAAAPPVDSHLELRFSDALQAAGLTPERQLKVVLPTGAPVRLDFGFAPERVSVEIDHQRWHGDVAAVHRDKGRDVLLAQVGFQTLRFTEVDVERRLDASVEAVRTVLRVRRRQLGLTSTLLAS